MHYTHGTSQILGNVGTVREVGKTLKVSVSKTETWKDNRGQRMERTIWNTITLFERTPGFAWIKDNLKVGDLVKIEGNVFDTSYEKDGQTHYDTTLAADTLFIIPTGKKAE